MYVHVCLSVRVRVLQHTYTNKSIHVHREREIKKKGWGLAVGTKGGVDMRFAYCIIHSDVIKPLFRRHKSAEKLLKSRQAAGTTSLP